MDPAGEFAVIDLETSDLDAQGGLVMEIGAIVVSPDLHPVDEGVNIVVGWSFEELDDALTPFTRKMHTNNGLIDDCVTASASVGEAEMQVVSYLARHLDKGTGVLLNNNAPFERKWFDAHLSELGGYLHYRNVDASGLHEAARRWWPQAFAACPPKDLAHRALADCLETIAQARHYRASLMERPVFGTDELADLVPMIEKPDEVIRYAQRLIAAAELVRARQELLNA